MRAAANACLPASREPGGSTSVTAWTRDAMEGRLVRYADLVPCETAFLDSRTPGSDRKENFCIIGPGVSENAGQYVHISEPHGFNIGGARQPGGCVNSQHAHVTAEVFVVHSGHWRMLFGPDGRDGHVDVAPGDVVSLPVRMFRGFEKRDPGRGFLWVVLGGDDPGRVTWAPDVFARAEASGLELLRGGTLVQRVAGESLPPGAELEEPPSPAQLSELATPPLAEMAMGVCRSRDMRANPASPLARDGVEECGIVNLADTADGFPAGPIRGGWKHGFALRLLRVAGRARIPPHSRAEPEVIFVHRGELGVSWPEGELVMRPGDTMSVPVGVSRSFSNPGQDATVAYVVRGGDNPAAPCFTGSKA